MEVNKIKAADVEPLLMEEFIGNNGSADNYEQWKKENERMISVFCDAMEQENEGKLNVCFGETDKKLLEAFFLVSVRTRHSYGTKKLLKNGCIGKKVISKGFRYLVEGRWLEGIHLFYYGLHMRSGYERVISDGCKKIVKEKWLEGFKILWEKEFMNLKTLAGFALKERWTEALKYIIYFYEEYLENKDNKYYRNKWRWKIPVDSLLEDCKTGDLKFLLDNDLYKIEDIGEAVVRNNWKEGVALLIKRGADSHYLLKCAVSSEWVEGIEILLDKIRTCDNVTCGGIYGAAIEKRRYDLLEKCLQKWGNLECIDLSQCSDTRDVMDVVEIAERYNPDGHNWIAATDALYKWCDKYKPSWSLSSNSLESWERLAGMDLSWCPDTKIVDTIRQIAEQMNRSGTVCIDGIDNLEEWCFRAQRRLAAEFLLKHGADVNRYGETTKTFYSIKGEYYVTPLHVIVERQEYDFIKLLLEYGADVNAKARTNTPESESAPYEGMTPLGLLSWPEYAREDIQKRFMETVVLLVENGAKTMCISQQMPTFFLTLVQIGASFNQSILKKMALTLIETVCQNGEDIYRTFTRWDDRGRYKTKFACNTEEDDYDWIEYNHKQLIAEYAYKDVIDIFIKYGLDINSNFGLGRSLLHHCALNGEDMIEFLVSRGADVNAKDFNGQTPLLYILSKGGGADNPDIKEDYLAKYVIEAYYCLVRHGAYETDIDNSGNTARELLELWKKRSGRYEEYCDNQIQADIEAYEKKINSKNYGAMERLIEQYGDDEDAMQSDPDYWDYVYGLTDDE